MLDNTNTNTDAHLLYSTLPNIIIGFHGCDKEVFQKILYKHEPFKCSHNTYDWLGSGMYFWEQNLDVRGNGQNQVEQIQS